LVLGAVTFAFGADGDSFGDVNNVVTQFSDSGKGILGTAIRWIIGLLPLILFIIGIFGGMKYAKKQADQDQDSTKVYVSAVIGGIAGSMVGLLLIALIGTALLGSAGDGLDVLRGFWKGLLALS
jgi:hypothetical protein